MRPFPLVLFVVGLCVVIAGVAAVQGSTSSSVSATLAAADAGDNDDDAEESDFDARAWSQFCGVARGSWLRDIADDHASTLADIAAASAAASAAVDDHRVRQPLVAAGCTAFQTLAANDTIATFALRCDTWKGGQAPLLRRQLIALRESATSAGLGAASHDRVHAAINGVAVASKRIVDAAVTLKRLRVAALSVPSDATTLRCEESAAELEREVVAVAGTLLRLRHPSVVAADSTMGADAALSSSVLDGLTTLCDQ